MNFKRLPLEGSMLKEITFYGNAKDLDVWIETTRPDWRIYFQMGEPIFQLDFQGKVQNIIFEDGDDPYVGVKYLPLEDLKVRECVVDYPGTDYAWKRVLVRMRTGVEDPFDWGLSTARMTIVPAAAE